MKSISDRLLSLLLLVLLSPLFLLIFILIKLDDGGSVFFRQDRLGYQGVVFKIWKYRTMISDADKYLNQTGHVISYNRITRIGKILRANSLDELPQLFNILKGEMSFIGPRPALVGHSERYTDEQKKRLEMKPGITGLAQINGRNTLKWSKRIEYDIHYIKNFSLFLDLYIAFRTIKVVIFKEGIVLDRNPETVDDLKR